MKKNICAAEARKEIRQGLLIGPASLAAGLLVLYFGDHCRQLKVVIVETSNNKVK